MTAYCGPGSTELGRAVWKVMMLVQPATVIHSDGTGKDSADTGVGAHAHAALGGPA